MPQPRYSWRVVAAVFVALAICGAAASAWFFSRGDTLFYGDAEAHFNIARRIIDGRNPGYRQVGTPWLPLPHFILIPFVRNLAWWSSGAGGAIAGVICFVLAGTMLFAAARRFFGDTVAAATTAAVFALNPNLLYLQSTPMTEPVFFAAVCGILYCTVAYAQRPSLWLVVGAGLFAFCASWTRYDGWWLIPSVAAYFFLVAKQARWRAAILFGALASLGPILWFLHNWYTYNNPLEFYNGPDSAMGIYNRALSKGLARYPGDHDVGTAIFYFRTAVRMVVGTPLLWIGTIGVLVAFVKRAWWPVILLGLAPVFYVCSMYSSQTPIFVPQLWPNGYYNSRYGLAMLPLLAVGCGAVVAALPRRLRAPTSLAIVAVVVAPWILYPRPDSWLCWKESHVNYQAKRRSWTEAADYMRGYYRRGDGIWMQFGDDFAAVIRMAGIPIHDVLQPGDSPHWMAAEARPDLFLWENWAIAQAGDQVSTAMQKAMKDGTYRCVKMVSVKDAPMIEIYRRQLPTLATLR